MEPVLEGGDRVLVDLRAFRSRPPHRGEIVAVADPADPHRWLVKRVAAVGPEGAELPEPLLHGSSERLRVPVPPGHVFLLSENLPMGRDSRRFGPVPLASLRGKVWYRFHPKGRVGPLDEPPA